MKEDSLLHHILDEANVPRANLAEGKASRVYTLAERIAVLVAVPLHPSDESPVWRRG